MRSIKTKGKRGQDGWWADARHGGCVGMVGVAARGSKHACDRVSQPKKHQERKSQEKEPLTRN